MSSTSPQRPPDNWILGYFRNLGDLKQRLLEHLLVIRLALTALGGTAIDAAIRLGIPRLAAGNAIRVINRNLAGSQRHAAFDHAVNNLVQHLDTNPELVDYGRRRDALSNWEITPQQWRGLIDGLPGQLIKNRLVPHTHRGDGKRRLASTWVWIQATHGDHIYAPAVRPDRKPHDPAVTTSTTSTPAGAALNARRPPSPAGVHARREGRLPDEEIRPPNGGVAEKMA